MIKSGINSGSKKNFKKQHPFLFWIFVIFFGLIISVYLFYLYIAYLLPLPDPFNNIGDNPSTKIYDRNGVLLYDVLQTETGKKSFIPLDKIPKNFINAVLSAEDINYYSHPGVDLWAIGRALVFNVLEQRIVSGASTITQQLIRNMQGTTQKRNLWNKSMEALYAIRLSHIYSKDEILELYLNKIYFGNMAYGAETAAQTYFGKHIYDLDLAQMTFLAGLPQAPTRYDPYIHFEQAKKRQKYVLDQMVKHGFIPGKEAEKAYEERLKLRSNKHSIKAPHFVHYVLNELEEQFGENAVYMGGLQVKTTLDYNLQLEAERIIDRHIDLLDRHNVNNGALIALDVSNGQILTWVGSKDYFNDEIDGAIDMATALRQPGSSIKPLTYLLAFENGYNPATVIYDIPTQFSTTTGPYTPKNYDLEFHGPVRIRTALASSYNIPAVKVLEFVGVNNFISFLGDLGIRTLDESAQYYGLALTLGGGEVRLIDMAQAYNVIANYGEKFSYSSILEVSNSDGEVLYSWKKPESHYILGSDGHENSYLIIDILKDPNARIPGFGDGSVLQISHEAAVKTGTTRNFRDNWTIGFSPTLITAVWVGNADASPMENISGVDGAAPIWADFMESALENSQKYSFSIPDGITEKEICELSGKIPTENCQERVYELFSQNSVPTELDDYYKLFTINTQNDKIVPEECINNYPADMLAQKVLVAYPPELQKWAEGKGLALPQFEPCSDPFEYSDTYTNDYPPEQTSAISIESPANNDEYILTSTLPLDDQKVPFRVNVPYNTLEVKFFVDGDFVGSRDEKPYTYLWLPKKGRHKVKVETVLSDGGLVESGEVGFLVL
jgi:penicillin-binding protein 1C